jgi:hypothetical protein
LWRRFDDYSCNLKQLKAGFCELQVLGETLPDDVLLTSDAAVTQLIVYYGISADANRILDSALTNIYIKAVKRLIVTADIQPNELRRRDHEVEVGTTESDYTDNGGHHVGLDCSIADIDLYIIFPLPVIAEMFGREKFANQVKTLLHELYRNQVLTLCKSQVNENMFGSDGVYNGE